MSFDKITPWVDRFYAVPFVGWILRHRFLKFGTVGLSGTIINVVALYFNQEILFKTVQPFELRLHLSLSTAIFLATVNNYLWNRNWTWKDKKRKTFFGFFIQMGQYFVACGIAIFCQYVFTIILSQFIHYLISNVLSIILAAVITYALNDLWTFAVRRHE